MCPPEPRVQRGQRAGMGRAGQGRLEKGLVGRWGIRRRTQVQEIAEATLERPCMPVLWEAHGGSEGWGLGGGGVWRVRGGGGVGGRWRQSYQKGLVC